MEVNLKDLIESYKEIIKREALDSFKIHLLIYVAVNSFLAVTDILITGGEWFYYPLTGWGLGLVFHYLSIRNIDKFVERNFNEALGKILKEKIKVNA